MSAFKPRKKPLRLRSVLRRGHLGVALVAVTLASASMTLLGVLALKVYADHNLHLIARAINYTSEAAVVFDDRAAATEALAMIASTEAVAEARIYTDDGELLAHWQRPENGLLSKVEMLLADGLLEQPISVPILHQGQEIGLVTVRGHGANLLRFLLSGLLGVLVHGAQCLECVVSVASTPGWHHRSLATTGRSGPRRSPRACVRSARAACAYC